MEGRREGRKEGYKTQGIDFFFLSGSTNQDVKIVFEIQHFNGKWMFLIYMLIEYIKNTLKLTNNTHIFDPNSIWNIRIKNESIVDQS